MEEFFKPKYSIKVKIMLLVECLVVIIVLGTGIIATIRERDSLNRELEKRGQALSREIAEICAGSLASRDLPALHRLIVHTMQEDYVLYVVIYDQAGNVVLQTDPELYASPSKNTSVIDFVSPVHAGPATLGQIKLGYSQEAVEKDISQAKQQILVVGIVTIIIGAGLAYILASLICGPIFKIIQATGRVAEGDLSPRLDINRTDEIGVLARAFTKMTEDLQRTMVSRDYVDNILRSMSDALIVVGLDRKIKRVNKTTCELLGYKEEDLLGKQIGDLLPAASNLFRMDGGHGTLDGGSVISCEIDYNAADGKRIPVLFSRTLLRDKSGNPGGIISIAKDITDRKQAEIEISNLKRHIEYILGASKTGLNIIDADFNVHYIDPKRQKVYGDPGGKKCYEYFRKGKALCPDCQVMRAFKTQEIAMIEEEECDRQIQVTIIPFKNEIGEWLVAKVGVDITERKKAEQEKEAMYKQLLQAQKLQAIGTLAGGVAHDFNNILFSIFGNTELAQDSIPENSSAHTNLDEIIKAAKRARDLVQQILAFSRCNGQERKPQKIQPIISEVTQMLRSTLPSTISIVEDLGSSSGPILADATEIHQIVMNLCTNAYHSMRDHGGTIHISLKEEMSVVPCGKVQQKGESFIRLTVSDTGHGIDPAILERIFDPFFTTKGPGEGTGMGLSVVHGIVNNLGGHICVKSLPAKGSTFDVYFPAVVAETAINEVGETENSPGGHGRILVVDDEEQISRMVGEILERLGYQVTRLTDSLEALEEFSFNPSRYDLILVDQTMPNMTGVELAKNAFKIRPDIPVVLCTGFSESTSEVEARSIGIKEYLMKPVMQAELAKVIRNVLEQQEIKSGSHPTG